MIIERISRRSSGKHSSKRTTEKARAQAEVNAAARRVVMRSQEPDARINAGLGNVIMGLLIALRRLDATSEGR